MKTRVFYIICILIGILIFSGRGNFLGNEIIYNFANKYRGQDVIVISKDTHLLYYCKNGEIVNNDQWNGFSFSFPVRVALASRYYWTPEGEMFIESKKTDSQYIRFLKLSYPGAYGIHSAPTRYASYLNRMEKIDPDFRFATLKDDTRGCVQVENRIIKYLFAKVNVGTPVLVVH